MLLSVLSILFPFMIDVKHMRPRTYCVRARTGSRPDFLRFADARISVRHSRTFQQKEGGHMPSPSNAFQLPVQRRVAVAVGKPPLHRPESRL
jgi:hypothetical protein